jgi:5-exo-hydroxycamphor dehydrogenase
VTAVSTGRAAVLIQPGKLEQRELPISHPEPGGVLVRVTLAGVCGSDVHLLSGDAGVMPFPIILGHEGVGVVEELGAGVTTDYASRPLHQGDLVYWAPIALCGHCYSCSVLDQTPCENSQFFEDAAKPNWGSYADYAWLPRGMAFYKLPDGASPEAVIALGCALPTALRGNDQAGPVQIDETVVVQGAGPVGLSAILVAKAAGAREIIAIDGFASRLQAATRLGATTTFDLSATSAEERKSAVWELCGPAGPSLIVEAAGVLPAFPEGIDLAGNHGRYSILGLWGAMGTVPIQPRELTIKNLHITGATFPKPKHYYRAMNLAARLGTELGLADLVTHRFAIDEAPQALAAVEAGKTIKAVIDTSR